MTLHFHKYHGAGNDFIMIDNKAKTFPKNNKELIAKLCHRNFGIGADGLILLEDDTEFDFRMVYYNADGNESTMCGNGGRCIVAFAHKLGLFDKETVFIATDGLHHATINDNTISLQMIEVNSIDIFDTHVFTNTGSPHHVELVEDLNHYDVVTHGRNIRNNIYGKEGSNINFVQQLTKNTFKVRTYERGVEDETLACGTGATAVAIAMHATQKTTATHINIPVEGGNLAVTFSVEDGVYKNVHLIGPAMFVFNGSISI